MSVRAIAIRSGPRPALAAAPLRARRHGRRAWCWASFADDRRFVGAKVILLALLFLAVIALEVPL